MLKVFVSTLVSVLMMTVAAFAAAKESKASPFRQPSSLTTMKADAESKSKIFWALYTTYATGGNVVLEKKGETWALQGNDKLQVTCTFEVKEKAGIDLKDCWYQF